MDQPSIVYIASTIEFMLQAKWLNKALLFTICYVNFIIALHMWSWKWYSLLHALLSGIYIHIFNILYLPKMGTNAPFSTLWEESFLNVKYCSSDKQFKNVLTGMWGNPPLVAVWVCTIWPSESDSPEWCAPSKLVPWAYSSPTSVITKHKNDFMQHQAGIRTFTAFLQDFCTIRAAIISLAPAEYTSGEFYFSTLQLLLSFWIPKIVVWAW